MNLERVKKLYDYHFTMNKKYWGYCAESLTKEQFTKSTKYFNRSVRDLFVHIMGVDNRWFTGLRGSEDLGFLDPSNYPDFDKLRTEWDRVESEMREYLDGLSEEDIDEPFQQGIDVWHVLLHVVNHGTQHRAQIGAVLRVLGKKPLPQDFVFFVMGRI